MPILLFTIEIINPKKYFFFLNIQECVIVPKELKFLRYVIF